MNWYSHPDTLGMAQATNIANRSGFAYDSIEYRKAYADAYEKCNGPDAAEYIAELRRQIAADEAKEGGK